MTDLSINIDFQILNTYDPKVIGIGDSSNWGVGLNNPAYLLVKVPGSKNSISINFLKQRVVFLNSINLGLSCINTNCEEQTYEDLPDGVWEFTLQSAFNNINKKRFYLKDDSLRQDIDKLRIRNGFEYNPNSDVLKALKIVEHLLLASHAYIRRGEDINAMKGYEQASKIVEKYKECKNCL